MSSLKHRLFAAAFAATSALRADRWLRPLAQGCGAILMFHHVRPWRERAFAPNRLLEITPEFLDRALAIAVAQRSPARKPLRFTLLLLLARGSPPQR